MAEARRSLGRPEATPGANQSAPITLAGLDFDIGGGLQVGARHRGQRAKRGRAGRCAAGRASRGQAARGAECRVHGGARPLSRRSAVSERTGESDGWVAGENMGTCVHWGESKKHTEEVAVSPPLLAGAKELFLQPGVAAPGAQRHVGSRSRCAPHPGAAQPPSACAHAVRLVPASHGGVGMCVSAC